MVFLKEKTKTKAKQKKNETMILSSNVLKRWSFQKIAQEYDLSCIIWKDGIFPKDDLSQKIHGNMIFSVYTCKCYKHGVTPPVIPHPQPKKNQG